MWNLVLFWNPDCPGQPFNKYIFYLCETWNVKLQHFRRHVIVSECWCFNVTEQILDILFSSHLHSMNPMQETLKIERTVKTSIQIIIRFNPLKIHINARNGIELTSNPHQDHKMKTEIKHMKSREIPVNLWNYQRNNTTFGI